MQAAECGADEGAGQVGCTNMSVSTDCVITLQTHQSWTVFVCILLISRLIIAQK